MVSEKTKKLFLEKINKAGPAPAFNQSLGACWIWTAAIRKDGYGFFGTNQRSFTAHRFSYELHNGKINEDGMDVDHLCRVKHCVNPAHLELVTHQENCIRGFGWPGTNARKTHCKNGHEFNIGNTIIEKFGRKCRLCNLERVKKRSKEKYWSDPEKGREISREKNRRKRARDKST